MVDTWMTEKINNIVCEDSIGFGLQYCRRIRRREMDDPYKMEKAW